MERFTSKPALGSVERAPTLQFTIDDVGLELARNDQNQTSSSLEIPTGDATNKAPDPGKAVAAAAPASTGISQQIVPGCYVRLNSGFQLYSNYDNTSLFGLADILVASPFPSGAGCYLNFFLIGLVSIIAMV